MILFIVVVLEDTEDREKRGGAECSDSLPDARQNCITTLAKIYATLENFVTVAVVTIQTNTLPGSSQQWRDRMGIQDNKLGPKNSQ